MLVLFDSGIHGEDIDSVVETYNHLSEGWFSHASPTMFNSGTPQNQLSSCFLLTMKDDSIEGIYDTLKTCAMISKTAGGIGALERISMHSRVSLCLEVGCVQCVGVHFPMDDRRFKARSTHSLHSIAVTLTPRLDVSVIHMGKERS